MLSKTQIDDPFDLRTNITLTVTSKQHIPVILLLIDLGARGVKVLMLLKPKVASWGGKSFCLKLR